MSGVPGAPLWKEIVLLIRSMPKPPVRARVVSAPRDGEGQDREAVVFFDGLDVWVIDSGARVQIATSESALMWQNGELQGYRGGGVVADNWVKSHLVGSFAYIRESKGSVVGDEILLNRDCWIVETPGLNRGAPDRVTRLWVDKEHGFILRMNWADAPSLFSELTELTIGSIIRPFASRIDDAGGSDEAAGE